MATLTKGKTFTNGELVTPASLHTLVDSATVANITNADIAAGAAIADTKLAQISAAGKVLPAAVQGTAVITTDSRLSDARTPTAHTHDDRYYTESEMNTLLAGKQASGSYAPATGIAPSAITGTAVITTDSRLSDARTPTTHTHDDRYYTETEMNTLLAGKQASGSYAPATGIAPSAITGTAVITTDSRLSDSRSPLSHTHDDRYYTESEVNSLLAAKQNSLGFTPVQQGGGANQGTNKLFMGWSSDSQLRLQIDSTDFGPNWPINVTGTASGNAPASHTHDDRYYTESEMNTLLAGKQQAFNSSSEVRLLITASGAGQGQEGIDLFYGYTNPRIFINSYGANQASQFLTFGYAYSDIGSIAKNAAGTSVSYNTTSDYRLKTNIEPLTAAVARLLQIPAHRFNWLADPSGQKVDGFLAHEAQAVVPEAVTGTKDAVDADGKPIHQGIDQSKLVPLLVAAVQELAARVAALEAK
jgi:hypothetical protein